jgi:hypothetical protein
MLKDIEGRATVDYMLRTAQQNQMALTSLADQKANIVLGLTFLLTTLTATRFAQGEFPPALLMLLVSAIAAALFALAALIPGPWVVRRPPAKEGAPAGNPLFFGGIAAFDYPDYLARMAEVMRTNASVYEAIIADLHAGALALRRKYLWLRYSYVALVTGLALSGLDWLALYLFA